MCDQLDPYEWQGDDPQPPSIVMPKSCLDRCFARDQGAQHALREVQQLARCEQTGSEDLKHRCQFQIRCERHEEEGSGKIAKVRSSA